MFIAEDRKGILHTAARSEYAHLDLIAQDTVGIDYDTFLKCFQLYAEARVTDINFCAIMYIYVHNIC